MTLDNHDDKDDDDDDDDDGNSKDAEVVEIDTGEALTMLDRLVNLKYLSKEERNSLPATKDKLEKIRALNKKALTLTTSNIGKKLINFQK